MDCSLNTSLPLKVMSSSYSATGSEDNHDKLYFYYSNATSLNNKLHLLEAYSASFLPDIIGITERWYDESSTTNLNGYKIFRIVRRKKGDRNRKSG
ncbi:hypothetical protein BpHYR1_045588 [Brachionus plicatilis]|uniref:Uncharacterized protein n=1 Tax=Brachionus plicatilis TaxID=10195 RepID=A0A3M7QPU5_BRAPC|nr:hypothetical protein BpHYR1_045588 [Brachionus plicatilis]